MQNNTRESVKKTNTMQLVELKFGMDIIELLKQDYLDKGQSIEALAKKYSVSTNTVHKWLVLYDIPRRHITFA